QFGVSAAIVFAVIQRLMIQARFADLQGPPTFSKQMLVWEKLPRFAHCHKRTSFRRLDRWKQKTVSLAAANGLAEGKALLVFFCIFLVGCHSQPRKHEPS